MDVANLLNNTVLVPYHDSLGGQKLPDMNIVGDLEKYNINGGKKPAVLKSAYKLKFTSNGATTESILCQRVEGISVDRPFEKVRSGGESLYETKVPGRVGYGQVTFHQLYTNSPTILNWLFNGASRGGALLADIEITIGDDKFGYMVYTLRDAFPIGWTLGNISVINADEANKLKSGQAKSGQAPMEQVTVVYGRLDYKSVPGKSD